MNHDCEEVVRGLSEKLRARARHVLFLLGAGASCSGNLPDLNGLKEIVYKELDLSDQKAFAEISDDRNLEEILTRLRLIGEALAGTDQKIEKLTSDAAVKLDRSICVAIAKVISTASVDIQHHTRFGQWVGASRYDRPIEIATTNYDLLIEKGLEAAGTPYFDGFTGIFGGRFRPDLVEEEMSDEAVRLPRGWARIWKLHGSVSWIIEEKSGINVITRLGSESAALGATMLAIYPSFQKYEESRRLPFVTLADRLRRSLAIPETVVVTSGYSFGDQHINELLYDAALFHPRSEIVALFRDEARDQVIKRAESLPNLTVLAAKQATVGSLTGGWDFPSGDTEFCEGSRFTLGDFGKLAAFLARRINSGIGPATEPGGASTA